MLRTTELWILDNMDEGPYCPKCKTDIQKTILDLCYLINKRKKWTGKLVVKCPCCKSILTFDVNWIPEYVIARQT